MHETETVRPSRRWRRTAQPVSEEEVLAAIEELSTRYRAPSTSLITWRLARGGAVTAAFQARIRNALQHLRASGRVESVMHRGTHRWSLTIASEPVAATAGLPSSWPASR
jgi:hypothetical protein